MDVNEVYRLNRWYFLIEQAKAAIVGDEKAWIWAIDYRKRKRNFLTREEESRWRPTGKKYMCTRTPQDFFMSQYLPCRAFDRHFYEVVRMDHPCHLYIDSEIDWTDQNRQLVPDVLALERLGIQALQEFARTMFSEWGDNDTLSVRVYDSSSERKWSRHYIVALPGGRTLLRSPAHAGAFMRRFRNHTIRTHGSFASGRNPFVVWRSDAVDGVYQIRKGGVENAVFLFDLAVYTRDRQFRALGCCKMHEGDAADSRFLRPATLGEHAQRSSPVYTPQYVEEFDQALVCPSWWQSADRLLECTEEDGSTPRSTNQLIKGRPDTTTTTVPLDDNCCFVTEWSTYPFERVWSEVLSPLLPGELRSMAMRTEGGAWRRRGVFFRSAAEWRRHWMQNASTAVCYDVGPVVVAAEQGHTKMLMPDDTKAVAREWTLDLDLCVQDRPAGCQCGNLKMVCARCWPTAVRSAQFYVNLMESLTNEKASVFFSGGRGVHIWLSARRLADSSQEARQLFYETFLKIELVHRQIKRPDGLYRRVWSSICGDATATTTTRLPLALDHKVFTEMGHMCKIPFSTHPKCGRLSRPLAVCRTTVEVENQCDELPFSEL